jgi:hypothetical protein
MNAHKPLSRILVPAICLAAIVVGASAASACPSCQAALAQGQGDLARGLYYSILFMMSMPFAIVGTFAGLMYRAVKREQRRKALEAAQKESAHQPRGEN